MLFAVTFLGLIATGLAVAPVWAPNGCGRSKYPDAGNMELPSGLIVGGMEARAYEFPWQASVRRASTDSHFCGGIVLNERWILTAAHCMDGEIPSRVSIVVGDWQRSAADNAVRQTMEVSNIFVHDGYSSSTMQNDISLVKVASDIVFSEDLQPVCAPDPVNLYTYSKSACSGWGTLESGGTCCPDILQYVTLNITTNEFCNREYGVVVDRIYDDMICASDNIGGIERDSCQGDSGGPLVVQGADGLFSVVGIVSWGIGCASGYPGVYARVGYFVDWVIDIINNN
jgi:secreted trypsin-like serine protease